MMDIYNYKRRLETTLRKVRNSDISKQNKKDIFDFHNFCFSEGIGHAKIQRYVFDLHKIATILKKDFKKYLEVKRAFDSQIHRSLWDIDEDYLNTFRYQKFRHAEEIREAERIKRERKLRKKEQKERERLNAPLKRLFSRVAH